MLCILKLLLKRQNESNFILFQIALTNVEDGNHFQLREKENQKKRAELHVHIQSIVKVKKIPLQLDLYGFYDDKMSHTSQQEEWIMPDL